MLSKCATRVGGLLCVVRINARVVAVSVNGFERPCVPVRVSGVHAREA